MISMTLTLTPPKGIYILYWKPSDKQGAKCSVGNDSRDQGGEGKMYRISEQSWRCSRENDPRSNTRCKRHAHVNYRLSRPSLDFLFLELSTARGLRTVDPWSAVTAVHLNDILFSSAVDADSADWLPVAAHGLNRHNSHHSTYICGRCRLNRHNSPCSSGVTDADSIGTIRLVLLE